MASRERDTFRDELDEIQKQINRMGEKVNYSINFIQTCQATINDCAVRISELEPDNTTSSPQLPDRNGFWRDNEGDIWAYDGDPDNPPRLIFSTTFQEVFETPADNTEDWANLEDYTPFTKISDPFTIGDNHADR